jgi:hypothetical protein
MMVAQNVEKIQLTAQNVEKTRLTPLWTTSPCMGANGCSANCDNPELCKKLDNWMRGISDT